MSQSISERLHKWCVKMVCWNALVLGLLPAPFNGNARIFQSSKLYLYYSFLIQCTFLAICPWSTPLLFTSREKETSYMRGEILLLLTYIIGKFARVLAIFVLCIEIWGKRQQILSLYKRYRMFKMGYEELDELSDVRQQFQVEIRRVQVNIVYKYFTGQMNVAIAFVMSIVMQKLPGRWYIIMVGINVMHGHILAAANVILFIVLSQMHLHFAKINNALEAMQMEKRPQIVINGCRRLYKMHFECYQLSLRILKLCRSVIFFTLIEIFTTNIIMLYHAVLFCTRNIPAKYLDFFLGTLAIGIFYWDTVLITIVISNLQVSCNQTSTILGYLVEKKQQQYASEEFIRMFNEFHHYLAGHKLNFYIFGMFNINKNTILQYFTFALVHLIVLVQYDMQLREST